MIAFSIILAFNPAQIYNFLGIESIPYVAALGGVLLFNGAVAYYFHFLDSVGPIKRRVIWLPAILVFYWLAFYSSSVIVNSLASYMFFALGSLYLMLLILNNHDPEVFGKPLSMGIFLVNIAAFFYALIILLDPAKYIPSYGWTVNFGRVIAGLLTIASAATLFVEVYYRHKYRWVLMVSGGLLTILFTLTSLSPDRTQAVLPFFIWLGIFFRPSFSYQDRFQRKTGSIKRFLISYSALIIIVPLLIASVAVTSVSSKHHLEMAYASVNNATDLAALYVMEHVDNHVREIEEQAHFLEGRPQDLSLLPVGVDSEDSSAHIIGAAIVSTEGEVLSIKGEVNIDRLNRVISNASGDKTIVADDGLNVLIKYHGKEGDYYLYHNLDFSNHLKGALEGLIGSEIETYIIDENGIILFQNLGSEEDLGRVGLSGDILLRQSAGITSENNYAVYKIREVAEIRGLRLVFLTPKSHIVEELGLLKRVIIYIIVAAFGVGLALTLILSAGITEPLLMITKSIDTKRMKFNLKVLNKYLKRKDEIGLLVANFYELYFKVFDAMKELNQEKKKTELLYKEESDWSNILKTEVEKMEAIFSGIGDGVFVLNQEGQIEKFNQVALTLTEKKPDEVLGKTLTDLFTITDRKNGKMVPVFVGTAKTKKVLSGLNLVMCDRGKLELPISFITTTIHDLKGSQVGAVFVFHDYTEEYELDEAKSEFVSIAAHQLRAPLTAIKLGAELLKEQFGKGMTADQEKILDILVGANARLIDLVNDLLNVSRIDAKKIEFKPEVFNLSALIESIGNEMQVKAKDKQQLFKLDLNRAFIKGDKNQLHEAFQNLIENAIKYTPKGGDIDVRVVINKKEVIFTVRDSGIGISKQAQRSLFKKFFRADNAQEFENEGTGLGLYIAKHAIEVSGGEIQVSSEVNEGTTFKVVFPAKAAVKELAQAK